MTSGPCDDTSTAPGAVEEREAQITELVRLFYSRVHDDELIGPIFDQFVRNWDHHLLMMQDFWCTQLLGAGRYHGNGFIAHMRLPLEEIHFDRWLALWERTVPEVLPPDLAKAAIGRARHMANTYRTGLLPYKRPDGSLSRTPS